MSSNPVQNNTTTNEENIVAYNPPLWLFWRSRRYVVTLLAFLGTINMYCLRANFAVDMSSVFQDAFGSTLYTMSYISASFFFAYHLSSLIGAYTGMKYGGRNIFVLGLGCATILTLLTPYVSTFGYIELHIVRIFQGLFEGVCIPALITFFTNWCPPLQRSRLMTLVLAGAYLGSVISVPTSLALESLYGRASISYVFGALSCVWCILFWILVKNSPREDTKMSDDELKYILHSLEDSEKENNINIPICQILKSAPVWSYILAYFSAMWTYFTWVVVLPNFVTDVLNIKTSVFLWILPFLTIACSTHLAGHLADYLQTNNKLPVLKIRRLFICGGLIGQSILMIALTGYWYIISIVCLVLYVLCGGFCMAGLSVNTMDLSPRYAGVIFAIANTITIIPGGGVSYLFQFFYTVAEESHQHFSIFFRIIAGQCIFGAVSFYLFGTGRLQPWNSVSGSR